MASCARAAGASVPTTCIRTSPGRSTNDSRTRLSRAGSTAACASSVEGPKGVPGAPPHVEEIGYYIPEAPPKNPSGTIQINHAIVDEKGLIYANDRFTGGLYILRYTGSVLMD